MKKIAAVVVVALFAAVGCGGGGSSWQDDISSAVDQMEADGVGSSANLPIQTTSNEEIESSIDELCAQFDSGAMPSDQLSSLPAVIMISLRQQGASTDTLKTFGKGLDGGMADKCPAAKEDLFGAGPLTSWEQAATCDGDVAALVTDPAGALASMCSG